MSAHLPVSEPCREMPLGQRLICIGVLVAFDLFAGWIVVSMAL